MAPPGIATRIPALDILRGFALFGVLVVNISGYLGARPTQADLAVRVLKDLLFSNKFWPIFSLLFGVGIALQLQHGLTWTRHLRRMSGLFLFGLILLIVFDGNQILVRYAILGCVLYFFRNSSQRSLLFLAAIFLVLASVDRPLCETLGLSLHGVEGRATFLDSLRSNLAGTVAGLASPAYYLMRMNEILVMFFFGLYLAKSNNIPGSGAPPERTRLQSAQRIGLTLGLMGTLAHHFLNLAPANAGLVLKAADRSVMLLSNDAMAIGYAASICLLSHQLGWLAPAGRMALTNFLTQWAILRLLFDPLFLGMKGKHSHLFGLALSIAIFGAQVLWSKWWLQRYKHGPAEWLWRKMEGKTESIPTISTYSR
ncbi:MAG: DUF418 domain-containing protein [Bdellovibrionales bacterium]|nr:DUF418 domain-containing protein [Bdellovibrionales bacterium]